MIHLRHVAEVDNGCSVVWCGIVGCGMVLCGDGREYCVYSGVTISSFTLTRFGRLDWAKAKFRLSKNGIDTITIG